MLIDRQSFFKIISSTLLVFSQLLAAEVTERAIHTLASLVHLIKEGHDTRPIENLWDQLQIELEAEHETKLADQAQKFHALFTASPSTFAKDYFDDVCNFRLQLLESEQIDSDSETYLPLNRDTLKKNPSFSSVQTRAMAPYLLPLNHPLKNALDTIFSRSRALQDALHFEEAGFITWKIQPRSFIRVALHPDLPGHLVKVYLDDELRIKQKKPGWYWFVKRCEGAKLIANVIKKKKIQHFIVASKWIYVLPTAHVPPMEPGYKMKTEILLAQKIDIVSNNKSKKAWMTLITREHLDELYCIISRANGSSYRPDNIPYTNDGKFAFIDTEYPFKDPNFASVTPYLNEEMALYWNQLIESGGP